jgi:hypothetical protein
VSQYKKLANGDWAQLVELTGKVQKTIQTHNAVSVSASTGSSGAWIDTSGYSSVALSYLSDGSHTNNSNIQWSHDGVNIQTAEVGTSSANRQYGYARLGQPLARYVRVQLVNGDTVAHTMSGWLVLGT